MNKKHIRIAIILISVLSIYISACSKKADTGEALNNAIKTQISSNQVRSETTPAEIASDNSTSPQSIGVSSNKQPVTSSIQPKTKQDTSNDTDKKTTTSTSSSIKYDPAKAIELYNKGYQIYLDRNYNEAINYFNQALNADPNCYMALNGKGIALCFKGSYTDGFALIQKSLSIKPDFAYANFNMALAYKLQKNYKDSLVWFDKAIYYDKKNTWSYFGKACIYAEWNDDKKALENLRMAIETDPGVKETAANEEDLNNIKSNPEFKKLIN